MEENVVLIYFIGMNGSVFGYRMKKNYRYEWKPLGRECWNEWKPLGRECWNEWKPLGREFIGMNGSVFDIFYWNEWKPLGRECCLILYWNGKNYKFIRSDCNL
jgi:hypothetical protein